MHRSTLAGLSAIWWIVLLGVAANRLEAQESLDRTFGVWEATLVRDIMTDKARLKTVSTRNDDLIFVIDCEGSKVSVAYFVRGLFGDSTSTVRLRFDNSPPLAPQRWEYAADEMSSQTRAIYSEALHSSDPEVRAAAASMLLRGGTTTLGIPDKLQAAVIAKTRTSRRLAVEISPGERNTYPLRTVLPVEGLSRALQWLGCH